MGVSGRNGNGLIWVWAVWWTPYAWSNTGEYCNAALTCKILATGRTAGSCSQAVTNNFENPRNIRGNCFSVVPKYHQKQIVIIY